MDKQRQQQQPAEELDSDSFNYDSFINVNSPSPVSTTVSQQPPALITSEQQPQPSLPMQAPANQPQKSISDQDAVNSSNKLRKDGKPKKARQPRFQSRSARVHTSNDEAHLAVNNRLRTKIHLKELTRSGTAFYGMNISPTQLQLHPAMISPNVGNDYPAFMSAGGGNLSIDPNMHSQLLSQLSAGVNGPMSFSIIPTTYPFSAGFGSASTPLSSNFESTSAAATSGFNQQQQQQQPGSFNHLMFPSPILSQMLISPGVGRAAPDSQDPHQVPRPQDQSRQRSTRKEKDDFIQSSIELSQAQPIIFPAPLPQQRRSSRANSRASASDLASSRSGARF